MVRKSQGKISNTTRQKSSRQQSQRPALMMMGGTAAAMPSASLLLLLLLSVLVAASVVQQQHHQQQQQLSVVDAFSPTQTQMRTTLTVTRQQQRKQHRRHFFFFLDDDEVFKLRVVSSSSSSSAGGSSSTSSSHTGTTEEESEVERLLRKARELRAQATHDEQQIHSLLVNKKQEHEKHIDGVIDYLFDGIDVDSSSSSTRSSSKKKKDRDDDKTDGDDSPVDVDVVDPVVSRAVADRLKTKKVSKDTLEKIVGRLDDKLMIAEGKEHVCCAAAATSQPSVFERVTKPRDSKLMAVVEHQIECLLGAVQLLDDEFRRGHASTATGSDEFGLYSTTATEHTHWGAGHLYDGLAAIVKEKQRERHDQFLKRQQEFIDAQTIKPDQQKDQVHHKVKDDHGFLP
mmetsp:Transcript_44589/g.108092  ORF Transcript_44589/g.108092 Transcript_44589/m.108092 type:complete len:400 (+) Transcript_44589:888-2087(+)|eukprot:CAMPEP_0113459410 /NCGR_PEP_ID=MMETSP0014_2-20120614/10437_1 /TAXON_ID=2857 /ORGANISM="Nitzschia sp." /LENGTH=399 /DNA_ID=CAMNT_0000350991 /DNA_START=237 /DNA_END=1436 /DNA_ORIENTATION=+ /assembly_acc=CAM_ASM_000159